MHSEFHGPAGCWLHSERNPAHSIHRVWVQSDCYQDKGPTLSPTPWLTVYC